MKLWMAYATLVLSVSLLVVLALAGCTPSTDYNVNNAKGGTVNITGAGGGHIVIDSPCGAPAAFGGSTDESDDQNTSTGGTTTCINPTPVVVVPPVVVTP
jgi:hypothetical protein